MKKQYFVEFYPARKPLLQAAFARAGIQEVEYMEDPVHGSIANFSLEQGNETVIDPIREENFHVQNGHVTSEPDGTFIYPLISYS